MRQQSLNCCDDYPGKRIREHATGTIIAPTMTIIEYVNLRKSLIRFEGLVKSNIANIRTTIQRETVHARKQKRTPKPRLQSTGNRVSVLVRAVAICAPKEL
ncbi:hypothetical protein Trydic_g9634 [Trypoxylus dichotomus]